MNTWFSLLLLVLNTCFPSFPRGSECIKSFTNTHNTRTFPALVELRVLTKLIVFTRIAIKSLLPQAAQLHLLSPASRNSLRAVERPQLPEAQTKEYTQCCQRHIDHHTIAGRVCGDSSSLVHMFLVCFESDCDF